MRGMEALSAGKMEMALEEQEAVYAQALAEKTEDLIESYFSEREMQVDAQVELRKDAIETVILCPLEAYEWTQEDAMAFSAWSGISEERQEWVWN